MLKLGLFVNPFIIYIHTNISVLRYMASNFSTCICKVKQSKAKQSLCTNGCVLVVFRVCIVVEKSPETIYICGCDKRLTKSVGSCDGKFFNQTLLSIGNWMNEWMIDWFTGTLQHVEWDNEIWMMMNPKPLPGVCLKTTINNISLGTQQPIT
jgi:hypothetical protein